ncbi:MAG: lysine--tRNA ligase, partial [Deltaproteobacteria bacterium]
MEEQVASRRRRLEIMKELGLAAYPNHFKPDSTAADIHERYGSLDAESLDKIDTTHRLAGRVMALRSFGKACFVKLQDRTGRIQVYFQKNRLGDGYEVVKKVLEVGDIVGVEGSPIRTRTGELTILADRLEMLVKSLRPMPEKWHGLRNVEIRYRRRYLDLMVNPDVAELFRKRARLIRLLRRFFDERDFVEVETPMMHVLAGGATARPFITHHNALDMDLYLRVAPELHLKRLLVGGLERVYELNRCFRNEGISTQHNPEFTMLEFYQAYADFDDFMNLSEQLLAELAGELTGNTAIEYQGNRIELAPPYRRIDLVESVAEALGVDTARLGDLDFLKAKAKELQFEPPEGAGAGKLQMELFERLVEPGLVQPTFVTGFPLEVSPLARLDENRPGFVQRFELYVAGRELANAFSELNDPDDQRRRFAAQMEAKARGDEEAMPYDEDYVQALEY